MLFSNFGLPLLITICLLSLAWGLAWFSEKIHWHTRLPHLPAWLANSPTEFSTTLSVIASIMASVVAILYSTLFVVQTLASSQFSPRLLRDFSRDIWLQICAGCCLGTLAYCLFLLGLLDTRIAHIKNYAILIGILLSIGTMFVLLYTIVHASQMIQINNIVARIARETHRAIHARMPEFLPMGHASDLVPNPPTAPFPLQTAVYLRKSGYFDVLDLPDLVNICQSHNIAIEVHVEIGEFTTPLVPFLTIHSHTPSPTRLQRLILRSVYIEPAPTIELDPEYGFRLLADIALKAISPAVNDPSTAVSCLDYLEALLVIASQRKAEQAFTLCSDGAWQIKYPPVTFQKLLSRACRQLRHYGCGDYATIVRMLRLLAEVGEATHCPSIHQMLHQEADALYGLVRREAFAEHDLAEIDRRYAKVLRAVGVVGQ
ncbi:MAG TPA: DUF2254 domain-containing protein [Anaerolineales bacterium]|nr:DUF2254 domain-containing protein [Anaerolineales bacterium]